MKWLLLTITLWLSSCGLQGLKPEERADITAATTLDAIHQVQTSAKTLFDSNSISVDRYGDILKATDRLTDLAVRIESASDIVGSDGVGVACVKVSFDSDESSACNRQDITQILIKIRESLK